jgi:hypothetical protein
MRATKIFYREFWGETKRADLLATLEKRDRDFEGSYQQISPALANRFSLRMARQGKAYSSWPTVRELSLTAPLNGPVERRGMALFAESRSVLADRMRAYFDPKVPNDALAALHPSLMMTGNRIVGPDARRKLLAERHFDGRNIVRMAWKPFDVRFCYLDNIRPLYSEPSPDLIDLTSVAGNAFFISRDDADTPDEGPPAFFASRAVDYDLLRGHARHFPALLRGAPKPSVDSGSQLSLDYRAVEGVVPNLSAAVVAWLATLGFEATPGIAHQVWHHALAMTYSPAWLSENAEAIRQGWPRIPLPGSADLLATSAQLGAQVAALLDPDAPVPGVTQGTPRPELAGIAVPSTAPGAKRDWALTGWGHRTEKGVTMPGRGRTDERAYASGEAAAAAQAALLGATTRDVWMNGASFWRNIPDAVWETHIGGYQVIKKWLSYRDHSILGRALTEAEVRHVQDTARRLAALRLMGPDLDASFRACAAAHVPLAG